MTNPELLWDSCVPSLMTQVGEPVWRAWFNEVRVVTGDEHSITLSVPASVMKERIESRYLGLMSEQFSLANGAPLDVHLVVETMAAGPEEADPPVTLSSPVGPGPADAVAPAPTNGTSPVALNPSYTFDAFITGPSNRFAEAAARAVAENPGSAYNPLFIYGGSGLGKTHLLHAIGNYVLEHFPTRRVLYVPAEIFLNQFIDSMRTKAQSSFKQHYRACDVLLVDDVDLLEGRETFQQEFFHTFNAHHQNSTQIVLSADRAPNQFLTMDARFRSRLAAGVTTPVEPPDIETRLAILGKKAERLPVPVPRDVLQFLATNVPENIRELEGALIRVSAFASLNSEPLTLVLAEKLLADVVASNRPRQVTPKMILECTGDYFGFTVDELCSPSRRRPLVTARQVGMYVCRQMTDHSYPTIAREFGGRDHTTVIHAVNKIDGLMQERRQIYDQVTELTRRLRTGE